MESFTPPRRLVAESRLGHSSIHLASSSRAVRGEIRSGAYEQFNGDFVSRSLANVDLVNAVLLERKCIGWTGRR